MPEPVATAAILSRRWLWVLLAVLAVDVAVSLRFAYMDPDPLLYSVVGEGIYRFGRWPYDYAFDHKPALIYLVYGLLSFVPRNVHEFQWLSVLFSLAFGTLAWRTFLRGRYPFWLCVVGAHVATIGSIGFSANTEAIYVPVMLASVWMVDRADGRIGHLAAAAALAAIAVNSNYVAAFVLGPTLLFQLCHAAGSPRAAIRRALLFGAAFVAACAAILALLALAGVDLRDYFTQQASFLAGYAEERRWPSIDWVLRLAAMLAVLPFVLRRRGGDPAARLDRALAVMIGAATVSLLVSGKYFPHYLYLVEAPAVLLAMRRATPRVLPRLCGLAVAIMLIGMTTNWFSRGYYDRARFGAPYERLAAIVGATPVMALRTSIAPQYYAHVVPFQPRIMWDFPRPTPLGPDEDRYYAAKLRRGPAFVLTAPGFCAGQGRGSRSCGLLRDSYAPVIVFAGEAAHFSHNRQQTGYALYRRTVPARPPAGS